MLIIAIAREPVTARVNTVDILWIHAVDLDDREVSIVHQVIFHESSGSCKIFAGEIAELERNVLLTPSLSLLLLRQKTS